MSSTLPHLQQHDERSLADIVAALRDGRSTEECYLAVSNGFWEPHERESFSTTFAAYEQFFADTVAELSRFVGAPDFEGRWNSPQFPDWAYGYAVAVWSQKLWLRLEHEDRECPIIIALSPFPA
jgi:hypothetical protein